MRPILRVIDAAVFACSAFKIDEAVAVAELADLPIEAAGDGHGYTSRCVPIVAPSNHG